jgi:hypothetical protein
MAFLWRMVKHSLLALGLLGGSLLGGVCGYHYLERLDWLDSLLNASMILGGMGPVTELHTRAGKLFASCFALYSGVVFLVIVGIVFGPIVHRILHRFHVGRG